MPVSLLAYTAFICHECDLLYSYLTSQNSLRQFDLFFRWCNYKVWFSSAIHSFVFYLFVYVYVCVCICLCMYMFVHHLISRQTPHTTHNILFDRLSFVMIKICLFSIHFFLFYLCFCSCLFPFLHTLPLSVTSAICCIHT